MIEVTVFQDNFDIIGATGLNFFLSYAVHMSHDLQFHTEHAPSMRQRRSCNPVIQCHQQHQQKKIFSTIRLKFLKTPDAYIFIKHQNSISDPQNVEK